MIQTIQFFFEWRVSYDIYLIILKHNKFNWPDQYEDWPLTLGEASWYSSDLSSLKKSNSGKATYKTFMWWTLNAFDFSVFLIAFFKC